MNDKPDVKPTKKCCSCKSEVKIATPSLTKPIQQLKKEPVEAIALKTPIEKICKNLLIIIKSQYQNEAKTKIQKIEPQIQPNYSQTVAITLMLQRTTITMFFMMFLQNNSEKTKVGGFLKKVKRMVERTNPITRLLEGNEEPVVAKKF